MTDTQKQCLLNFLGYDTGGIGNGWGAKSRGAVAMCQEALGLAADGVWGPQTETAVLEAVYSWEEPQAETGDMDALFAGIRYWRPEEFRCRCGEYHEPYCGGFPALPDRVLLELADDIREYFGAPGHRTSGVRCLQHNRDSGGAVGSRHLSGKALDFYIEGIPGERLLAQVKKDKRCRYAYLVGGQVVHMDVV